MSRVSFAKPGAAPEVPATAPVVTVPPLAPVAPVTAPVAEGQPVTTAPAETAPAAATETAPVAEAAPVAQTEATIATPTVTIQDNANTAVIPAPSQAVDAPRPAFFDDDSLDVGDLVLPRFNIVQKVGELSNNFAPGTLLLNGQLVLQAAPQGSVLSKPVKMLVIGFNPTVFVEKVEGGLRGKTFKTEQEVVNAGGTLDFNEAKQLKKVKYDRSATAMVLIEQPEGLDVNSFPTQIEGKNYVFALYTMKGTAYTNAAKHFKSARKIGQLREGYRHGWWTLSSQLKKFGENYSYIPVVNAIGPSTEALRAAVREFLGF